MGRQIGILLEVADYLEELAVNLYEKNYFGSKDASKEYEILIVSSQQTDYLVHFFPKARRILPREVHYQQLCCCKVFIKRLILCFSFIVLSFVSFLKNIFNSRDILSPLILFPCFSRITQTESVVKHKAVFQK